MSEWWAYLDVAEQAARAGGQVLVEWAERFTVTEKGPADYVTEADLGSQKAIQQVLARHYPRHAFVGEESTGPIDLSPEYCWIVDPLDGTSNYVHRFPYFAVSIALQHRGEIVVGVVYDPTRNEMFSACRGGGTHLNRKKVTTSRFAPIERAMVIASFPVDVRKIGPSLDRFLRVLPRAQTVHRSGSAALNLAYIGSGRLDGYWSTTLKAWDMAAGSILVTEGGGRISQMSGRPLVLTEQDLLATNGTVIHDELIELLKTPAASGSNT